MIRPLLFFANLYFLFHFFSTSAIGQNLHLDTLYLDPRYSIDTPEEFKLGYNHAINLFILKYNSVMNQPIYVKRIEGELGTTLTFELSQHSIVSRKAQVAGFLISTLGVVGPIIINSAGGNFPFFFGYTPMNQSRCKLSMNQPGFVKFRKRKITSNGMFGNLSSQGFKQGRNFQNLVRNKVFSIENQILKKTNDTLWKQKYELKYKHQLDLGLIFGFAVSMVKPGEFDDLYNVTASSYVGGTVGLRMLYTYKRSAGFEANLIYTGKASHFAIPDFTKRVKFYYLSYHLRYLEMPLVARVNLSKSIVRPYLGLGISPALVVDSDLQTNRNMPDGQHEYLPSGARRMEVGSIFQFGLDIISGGRSTIFLDFKYKHGLTSALRDYTNVTVNTWYINLGTSRRF